MPNTYVDINMFQARYTANAQLDSSDQSEILRVLEAASRRVDLFCHRDYGFYATTATRIFDGPGMPVTNTMYLAYNSPLMNTSSGRNFLRIPDLISATSVNLDEDGNRVFELALSATKDYILLQDGADNVDLPPYNKLQLDSTNGIRGTFSSRPRLIQIIGSWGYTNATETLVTLATLANATTTTMTTNVVDTTISIGQTFLLGSEQVYITAGSGTSWTVARGVNGTTAATQTAVAILRYIYLPEVREAAIITAGRLWKRRETAFSTMISNPGMGTIETYAGDDKEAVAMLHKFQRVVM